VSETPLADCRVLVTRPASQAGPLLEAIREAGGEPVPFPVIRIVPAPADEVAAAVATIPRPDIVVFVSRNAVEFGLDPLRDAGACLAAVGPATAAAVEARGGRVDIRPAAGFDSEHLLAEPALANVAGLNILIVRGQSGRELLADTLRARGAAVHYLSVYRREQNVLTDEEVDAVASDFARGKIDFFVALSVETLRNLLALLPPPAEDLLRKSTLVAAGERVIQGACELVPGIDACMAPGPEAGDIVSALIERLQAGQKR
jgi:uroporphyrinogen-III synthase